LPHWQGICFNKDVPFGFNPQGGKKTKEVRYEEIRKIFLDIRFGFKYFSSFIRENFK